MRAISMRVREKSCLVVLCGRSRDLTRLRRVWRLLATEPRRLGALCTAPTRDPYDRSWGRIGRCPSERDGVQSKEHGLTRDPRPTPNPLVSSNTFDFVSPPRRKNIICL
ncbi:hypothetical protein B0H12DRAFT_1146905, partial [Mycena haematopus]